VCLLSACFTATISSSLTVLASYRADAIETLMVPLLCLVFAGCRRAWSRVFDRFSPRVADSGVEGRPTGCQSTHPLESKVKRNDHEPIQYWSNGFHPRWFVISQLFHIYAACDAGPRLWYQSEMRRDDGANVASSLSEGRSGCW